MWLWKDPNDLGTKMDHSSSVIRNFRNFHCFSKQNIWPRHNLHQQKTIVSIYLMSLTIGWYLYHVDVQGYDRAAIKTKNLLICKKKFKIIKNTSLYARRIHFSAQIPWNFLLTKNCIFIAWPAILTLKNSMFHSFDFPSFELTLSLLKFCSNDFIISKCKFLQTCKIQIEVINFM